MMKLFRVLGVTALALFLGGCTGSVALYQSINADNAVVQTTTTLYQNNDISLKDAKTIYTDASTLEAALQLWQAALAAGTALPGDPPPTTITQDLQNLLTDLQAMQNEGVKFKGKDGTALLALPAGVSISSGDIITIIQLVIQLEPTLQSWVTNAFDGSAITDTQINTAFTDLNVSLVALNAITANPATTTSVHH